MKQVNLVWVIESFHPSILPSSSAYPGPGCEGSSLSRDAQTSLSLDTSSCSSGGIPRRSQASRETLSLQRGGRCPRKASRRHPEQMPEPPQLAPLDVEDQRLYSELLPSEGRNVWLIGKSRASPCSSAPFSPRQTGTSTALLQKLHRSVCQSPVPSFPYSWTRTQDT